MPDLAPLSQADIKAALRAIDRDAERSLSHGRPAMAAMVRAVGELGLAQRLADERISRAGSIGRARKLRGDDPAAVDAAYMAECAAAMADARGAIHQERTLA